MWYSSITDRLLTIAASEIVVIILMYFLAAAGLEVCRTHMYADYEARKALEDEQNVLRAGVTKLHESGAKRTDFEDKFSIVLNNSGFLYVVLPY